MTQRLALIHTVRSVVPMFGALTRELAPDVTTTNLVDEALLEEAVAAGEVPQATADRLERHVAAAVEAGASAVLVTCSSMGGVVDELRVRHGWQLLRVDEAMVDAALAAGSRIGVIATLGSTLRPTADLVRRRARDVGRDESEVQVLPRLVDGAFAALKAGDVEGHDGAVRRALRELLPQVDAIVLAQASMARVVDTLEPDESGRTPILASPRLGLERAVELVGLLRARFAARCPASVRPGFLARSTLPMTSGVAHGTLTDVRPDVACWLAKRAGTRRSIS
jgi:Asp/Glu/hydantoin racemase